MRQLRNALLRWCATRSNIIPISTRPRCARPAPAMAWRSSPIARLQKAASGTTRCWPGSARRMARALRRFACAGWCSRASRRSRGRRGWNGCRRTWKSSTSNCRKRRWARYPGWEAGTAGSPITASRQNGIETAAPQAMLERFQAKWIPVRVKKTRQNIKIEPRSDSIGTEKALETGRQGKLETKVEPQPAIRTGVTASAIAHLSILALVMLLSDVHPFHAVTAETIAVDIVTPQEVPPDKPEPPAQLQLPAFDQRQA